MCGLFAVGLLMLFAVAGTAGWWQGIRMRRRAERYKGCRCVACGYDVRASRDRCPECGADLFDQGLEYWKGQLPPSD